ncbi:hypothetical protein ACVOMV_12910 [Mesorhizobium atlanticum]
MPNKRSRRSAKRKLSSSMGCGSPKTTHSLRNDAGGGYVHVFVDASEELRRKRYSDRANDGDFETAALSEVERR